MFWFSKRSIQSHPQLPINLWLFLQLCFSRYSINSPLYVLSDPASFIIQQGFTGLGYLELILNILNMHFGPISTLCWAGSYGNISKSNWILIMCTILPLTTSMISSFKALNFYLYVQVKTKFNRAIYLLAIFTHMYMLQYNSRGKNLQLFTIYKNDA